MAREMKDSRIAWVKELPADWTRDKVVRLFDIIGSGTTPKSVDESNFYGDINWIQSGDINGGNINISRHRISQDVINKYSALKVYTAPFIVIAMYGASIGNLSISRIDGCVNQACCVLCGSKLDFKYAFYTIQATKDYLIQKGIGGGQPNISQEVIKQLWLPVPTLEEQNSIADFLDHKCAEIDTILDKTSSAIEAYKKLKQAIITQAVTKGIRDDRPMKDSGVEWIYSIPTDWNVFRGKHLFRETNERSETGNEDILAAFQPFYQETMLQQEVNVDLIYQTQKELRGYGIYTDSDIATFAKEYFKSGKQGDKSMGRMTSILKPVADHYNKKTIDERYQFRRQVRSLIKWYSYISQIVRMFDKELHQEFVFCSYLIGLLPAEAVDMMDMEGKLKLEYYKLQKTFDGPITLQETKGVYEPAKNKGVAGHDLKEPLDEIIEKINEKYKGVFTDGDRVMLDALRTKLMSNKKLASMAKTSDPQIFTESIFPKAFGDAAQDSFMEAQDTYTTLFEDQHKYNAIMYALAEIIYREMRKQ